MLARRNFRPAARHSEPVAHVLWTLHCDRVFLPGAAASFPGLPARLHIPDCSSPSAATSADLLVPQRAVQQGLQEPVVAQSGTRDALKKGLIAGKNTFPTDERTQLPVRSAEELPTNHPEIIPSQPASQS
jgi:hypothetical protein